MRYIDLFAGTGAFSHVLSNMGFECVFANDKEQASQQIYLANFPGHNFVLGDIININVYDIPEHNILCGGFPCQPFSIAGKKEGFNDPRSNTFWKLLEIIRHHSPEVIVLENVKNLLTHDSNNTFRIIKENLEAEGYHLKVNILDTCEYSDIPHHRERVFIVGFKENREFELVKPNVINLPIINFLEDDILGKYYYTNRFVVYEKIQEGVVKHINTNTLYQFRRHYVRENMSGKCPTLTANMGTGGHNVPLLLDDVGIRKLTPRECFNLQGFPGDYILPRIADSKLYKLAGNAVSVPVVRHIMEKIFNNQ